MECFSCFANCDQGDVVMLGGSAGEVTHVVDHTGDDGLRTVVMTSAGLDRFDHAFDAKLVARGIERFGHSVSVKEKTITALNRHIVIVSYPIEHASAVNSHHHPGRLDPFYRAGRGFIKQRRIVSRAGKGDTAPGLIENGVSH